MFAGPISAGAVHEPYLNSNADNPVYIVRVAEDMGTHFATYEFKTVDALTGKIIGENK